jgi:pullulanase
MMKNTVRILSLFLILTMLLSVCLISCGAPAAPNAPDAPDAGGDEGGAPAEEYTLPLEDGYNQLTIYFNHNDTYENCDVWIWWGDVAGKGYILHECAYGAKAVVNVPEGIEEVGFIVRKHCSEPGGSSWGNATKDFEADRFAVLDGRETVIYLKTGVEDQFKSNDGGKTLEMIRKFSLASMVDATTLAYRVTPKIKLADLSKVKVYEGEREIEVIGLSALGRESATGKITLGENLDLSKTYTVSIEGFGSKTVIPMEIFDSDYFAEQYHYDGNDLGSTINGENTTFKVWAPTASRVLLNLFEQGDEAPAYKTVDMVRGEKGVWSHTEACGHGTYYTYTVTTAVGTQEATDPYARAAGVNGDRSMVVDLALTDPEGFETSVLEHNIDSYSEAIIWEVHVRDFSNKIATSQYKGKYLAFTETGLVNEHGEAVGVDYLKALGITHVHLLPVYDYATVDESDPNAPFNWGYDPKNYNVPEGSYSTDPYHGEVRINEYKQMVAALHKAGIGVIMDVVYNHTYDANSAFNRIVPYYYYRYTSSGANSSASGCGNDTASERYMYGKFMVESASYWIEEYHLDGLRFDLMGLHDVQTMQKIESAVHAINPNAIIYGEGWTMGSTVDGSPQANQGNISKIKPTGDAIGAVAVFNDVMRDGLKGSVFDKTGKGYINGAATSANLARIVFSMRGGIGVGQGWSVEDAMVINYMSAHDNNTLWDKLLLSNPEASDEARISMNKLGAALILLSKGTPFWQAGEEMMRTKDGDENSYKSSDAINNIDWSVLKAGSNEYEMMRYYRGLIAMRKTYGIFTDLDTEITYEALGSGVAVITFDDGNGGRALALINPYAQALPCTLDGEWNLVAHAQSAGAAVLAKESGSVTVDGISVRIYVNDALVK